MRLCRADLGLAQCDVAFERLPLPLHGRQGLLILRFAAGQTGLIARALLLHLILVDARDDLALFDIDAFVDIQLDQFAGDFEGDVDLRQFEISGNAERVGVLG